MTAPARPLRMSPDGVVAVRDVRRYGGRDRPWCVIDVPPGHHSHYLTQPLSDQQVTDWSRLIPEGQP